jgi:uncharacterized protein YdcH (DUF465 family)
MAWIKRNLAFVIGGAVALGLLIAAGFYIFSSLSANDAARDKLAETYNTLDGLIKQTPSPGNDKVNNIQIAADQQKQLAEWISSATGYFQPIPSIPPDFQDNGNSAVFRSALATTIKQMQDQAANVSVLLPPNYGFSFEAYRNQLNLASAALAPLAVQLGEVKALTDILFAARVNSLDSIQRLRISDSDASGPQSDYLDDHATTNDLAVLTPYAVTFRSFTPEISQVLASLAASKYGFIVKSVSVQPAGAAGASASPDQGGQASMPGLPMPGLPPPSMPPPSMPPPGYPPAQPATPPPAKGGLQTILKEQLLRVTLQIEIVKLLPKK